MVTNRPVPGITGILATSRDFGTITRKRNVRQGAIDLGGRVDGGVAAPSPTDSGVRDWRSRFLACRVRSGGVVRPRDPGTRWREAREDGFGRDPGYAPFPAAPPASDGSAPEPGRLPAVAFQTTVVGVNPDHAGTPPAGPGEVRAGAFRTAAGSPLWPGALSVTRPGDG